MLMPAQTHQLLPNVSSTFVILYIYMCVCGVLLLLRHDNLIIYSCVPRVEYEVGVDAASTVSTVTPTP